MFFFRIANWGKHSAFGENPVEMARIGAWRLFLWGFVRKVADLRIDQGKNYLYGFETFGGYANFSPECVRLAIFEGDVFSIIRAGKAWKSLKEMRFCW